jgi:hypothetical protein
MEFDIIGPQGRFHAEEINSVTTERITDIIEKVNAGEAAADDRLISVLYI